jgi:hypothetical protein
MLGMSTGSLFVWVLFLNDMRLAHVEELMPVARADSPEALKDFVDSERVALYREPTGLPPSSPTTDPASPFSYRVHPQEWCKVFRKGGPLEWYNPPSASDLFESLHYRPLARVIDYSAEVDAIPEAVNLRRRAVGLLEREHP